jgi:hypothetical protein
MENTKNSLDTRENVIWQLSKEVFVDTAKQSLLDALHNENNDELKQMEVYDNNFKNFTRSYNFLISTIKTVSNIL